MSIYEELLEARKRAEEKCHDPLIQSAIINALAELMGHAFKNQDEIPKEFTLKIHSCSGHVEAFLKGVLGFKVKSFDMIKSDIFDGNTFRVTLI